MDEFVYIIESPSDSDLLEGRTEGRVLSEALRLAGICHKYNLATTKNTFSTALYEGLLEACNQYPSRFPILHLSMHGDNDGVSLTDGTNLSWETLRCYLTPLTNAGEGHLLICMSSCFGASGCRMAMHEGTDQPFWALVGNAGSASWEDAAVAYVTFYHLFFKDLALHECVERMKMASNDSNFIYHSGHHVKEKWAEYMAVFRRERFIEALRRSRQQYTPQN